MTTPLEEEAAKRARLVEKLNGAIGLFVFGLFGFHACDGRAQDRPDLVRGLAAEEGGRLTDGHTALLFCFRERATVVGISDAEEARRYCSALRGLPQSPWGEFVLALEEPALYKIFPEITELVDAWLDGKPLRNPCDGRPWHFGGRRAAAQRPHAFVLHCGNALSTFFGRPR